MKEGPNIALLGTLIGDPARANMLSALLNGIALTATELAQVAGITAQTASSHLKKLEQAGLLSQRKQGRHRYFCLADEEVANVLEWLICLAESKGHTRIRTGPRDPALKEARVCYNHLAGDMGVRMYDSLVARQMIALDQDALSLTQEGQAIMEELGLDLIALSKSRRAFCKPCLDWSARRYHMAGALGSALLDYMLDQGWAKREEDSRAIRFNETGKTKFKALFPL